MVKRDEWREGDEERGAIRMESRPVFRLPSAVCRQSPSELTSPYELNFSSIFLAMSGMNSRRIR